MNEQTDDDRARRLAAALRENLKRRKAQARGRSTAADQAAPEADATRSPPRERD